MNEKNNNEETYYRDKAENAKEEDNENEEYVNCERWLMRRNCIGIGVGTAVGY